jgi:hypothetical protein
MEINNYENEADRIDAEIEKMKDIMRDAFLDKTAQEIK